MKKFFFLLAAILVANMILFSQDDDKKHDHLTNFMSFNVTGAGSWTIPADVTKIVVEAWGGGGGGSQYGGGGGGGYIKSHFTVKPGTTISVNVGAGGQGGTTRANTGIATTVTIPDATAATYTLYANGGLGAYMVGNNINSAYGGGYSINPGYYYYMGMSGQSGTPNIYGYTQTAAGAFFEIINSGKGGDGGNSLNTGGPGGFKIQNGLQAQPAQGIEKGGGGGGGIANVFNGAYGGRGKVIIWY